jgi:hypothetical protein
MKQSDWLRSLSERAGFLHPARSETQLPALVFAPKTEEYKTYVEKTIYFLNAHVFGHLKAKKLQLKQIL